MIDSSSLQKICSRLRHDILTSSTEAGSGHPTSSLSAVELLATLFFDGHLHFNLENPDYIFNDRVIFSKGHASPLFYSLYHMAGVVSYEELLTFRKIDSNLEGHPTPRFKYTEAATGSLGQGLSIGLGMALGIKLKIKSQKSEIAREPRVWVLLGDSEMAEGQVWEAMEVASHYKVNNLIAIADINRLGQRGETMLGWDIDTYKRRAEAFGWQTFVVTDGNNVQQVQNIFAQIEDLKNNEKPIMIIAKTAKGKGVSFLENKDDWHGKAVPKDMLDQALREIGEVDATLKAEIAKPEIIAGIATSSSTPRNDVGALTVPAYDKPAATREAYGDVLVALGEQNEHIVVLDAEVSNSTFAERFAKKYPDRYFEMFIAEQNMASVAVGLSRLGFVPFMSSFAAFLSRAYDQIRMAQYSEANLKIAGSHAGVSIGYDGSSQMALEDLGMMRGLLESAVLYPSDPISAFKLAEKMVLRKGIEYIRLTREKTPKLYSQSDEFTIGGSKVLKQSDKDKAVVIAAGITLHEALKAFDELQKSGISVTIIDAYSVKPIDKDTLRTYAQKTRNVLVVEDHYPAGGLGDAVFAALAGLAVNIRHLSVNQIPHSGSPEELLEREEINAAAIIEVIKKF